MADPEAGFGSRTHHLVLDESYKAGRNDVEKAKRRVDRARQNARLNYGAALRIARQQVGWTYQVLAEKAEVSAPFLHDCEMARRYPSQKVADRILAALRGEEEGIPRCTCCGTKISTPGGQCDPYETWCPTNKVPGWKSTCGEDCERCNQARKDGRLGGKVGGHPPDCECAGCATPDE